MTVQNEEEFTPEEVAELDLYETERNARLRKAVIATIIAAAVLLSLLGAFA